MSKQLISICSVCDAQVQLELDIEESEIISCEECQSRLVVAQIDGGNVSLEEAPEVEEDWGQ